MFDGRNLYEPADVEAAGLAYYGIGRGARCMSDLLPTEREQALEARLVELEMRVSFQEQALAELSDALADARMQGMRNADAARAAGRPGQGPQRIEFFRSGERTAAAALLIRPL